MEIVKFTKDSPLQRIKAWYIDENSLELSPGDKEYKDRLYHMWSLRAKQDYTRLQAVEIISREYKVSQATAYRDYQNAQLIFGSLDATDAAAELMIYRERYEKLYIMAVKKNKIDIARKINDSLVSLLPPTPDNNTVDPNKLEASIFNVKAPRNVKKMMEQMAKNGGLNFMGLSSEDVEFKEVTDEIENDEDDE